MSDHTTGAGGKRKEAYVEEAATREAEMDNLADLIVERLVARAVFFMNIVGALLYGTAFCLVA